MNCERCGDELKTDPWLIGTKTLTEDSEWYAEILCKPCFGQIHPDK